MSPFSIHTEDSNEGKIFKLTDNATGSYVEIFEQGCILNQFIVNHQNQSHNFIDGYTSSSDAKETINTWFKSAHLAPFAGRLKNGLYQFNHQHHITTKHYLGHHAIHGLMFDKQFKLVHQTCTNEFASIKLQYVYQAAETGYPYWICCTVEWQLRENNFLSVFSYIENRSPFAVPYSQGWHPYFKLNNNRTEWTITLAQCDVWETDEDMIPNEKCRSYNLANKPILLADEKFDTCFSINQFNTASCVLENQTMKLNYYGSASMPFLQIFTPNELNNIAIEPLSSLPNSLNNSIGLTVLQPDETKKFYWAIQPKWK